MKSIKCKINDKYDLILKDVIETDGHNDSLPFVADIWFRVGDVMKLVGICRNDGWGAFADYMISPEYKEDFDIVRSVVESKVYKYGQYAWNYDIPFLLDSLAYFCIVEGKDEYEFECI